MVLRKTWERVYKQALEILRETNHPIAKYTLGLIENKTLEIITFNKVKEKDFKCYADDYCDDKGEKLPHHYPPSSLTISKIIKAWDAKINGNRVSINHTLSDPKKIAKILVHEANHFLNDTNDNYDTDEKQFTEEFRAVLSESLVFSKPLRKWKLQEIAKEVAKRYELPLPKSIGMPEGLFVPKNKSSR